MPKSKEYISSSDDDSTAEDDAPKKKQPKVAKKEKAAAPAAEKSPSKKAENGDSKSEKTEQGYPLGSNRFVGVSEFKGKTLINIREYYEKDGKLLPGSKGISLSKEQWQALKKFVDKVDGDLNSV